MPEPKNNRLSVFQFKKLLKSKLTLRLNPLDRKLTRELSASYDQRLTEDLIYIRIIQILNMVPQTF